MKTNVFEIAEGIFRVSVAPTNHFKFNHFLIVDVLFSSDLGAQAGINKPIEELNVVENILKFKKEIGFMTEGQVFNV
jgi:hypothetical protein